MKLHHYAMVFLIIITAVLATYVIKNHVVEREYNQSVKCENELTSSLLDAITDAVTDSMDGTYIFASERQRKKAYESFYATLSLNLNEYVTKDIYIQDAIPCIFLVDTDGYYVVFREDNGGTLVTLTSPLNVWSDYVDNGHFILRFYLTDYVSIIDRDKGTHYDGTTEQVKEKLDEDNLLYLFNDYIADYDTYKEKREFIVYKAMEESLNYYVNKYNQNHQYIYDLTIPATQGISKGQSIDTPCMFAFMQGKYFGLSGTDANVYAYANSQEIYEQILYCSDELYHLPNCPQIGVIEYKGDIKGCARHGYTPCPNCCN